VGLDRLTVFTAAAERLGATKAMVSQQVRRLEAELGAMLFTRTTRRVMLTEAGSQLYNECRPLLRELDVVLDRVGSEDEGLHGSLRLTASIDYVEGVLAPQLVAFAALHPKLQEVDRHPFKAGPPN
jgi:DNA-binding transcriptional LysR family regulator